MQFKLYSNPFRSIGLNEIIIQGGFAVITEGYYVEVARLNEKNQKWQRFAFKKFFDITDAEQVRDIINGDLFTTHTNVDEIYNLYK